VKPLSRESRHFIVIYHDSCIDGLAAAWVLHRKWGADVSVHLSYIPYNHHDIPAAEDKIRAEMTPGAALYFVDVAPTRAFLDQLMETDSYKLPMPQRVTIIDHHESAARALENYRPSAAAVAAPPLAITIDPDHPSAANMVWEKFLPESRPPDFFKLISKMDLARDLNDPRDLAAAALIDSKSITTVGDAFHNFAEMEKLSYDDMRKAGESILSDQKNRIDKLTDNILYTRLNLAGGETQTPAWIWVPVINADVQNFGRHISDYLRAQGDRTGLGMAFAWYVQGNAAVTMSIRSDGAPDASHVAECLCRHDGVQGGGHKTSAAVHFASLARFMEIIPLYTGEQMRKMEAQTPPKA
jgi:oligoribonuclease NrnB/cAMP/cGMP phosphodiesterase (DHH superfamily)